MKKTINRSILLMTASLLFWQCGPQQTTEESIDEDSPTTEEEPTLTQLWETEADLTTNESVLYDEATGNIYVANIEGDASEKDGKGSISTISREGEILEREWVSGLNAPKGMGIMDGKLYVTDIDEVVEIDVESANISNRYPLEGAQFLNDLDTHDGKVYFTDMRAGNIHVLENGEITTFAEGQGSINGLRVADDGTLYGLDGEGLKKYSTDGSFEMVNDVVTGGDGLVIIDDDTFIASRWKGEIYLIQDGVETKILDTQDQESNTADIDFIPDENIILVPTFQKNKVAAYQLTY
ncbi:MAG: ATP-binding protein [Anditalea sp.]